MLGCILSLRLHRGIVKNRSQMHYFYKIGTQAVGAYVGVISGYSTKLAHVSLRPYIKNYYLLKYTGNMRARTTQVLMPNGFPEALFVWGSGVSVLADGAAQASFQEGILCGQMLHTKTISIHDSSNIFGIVFTPLGFHRLVTEDSLGACDRVSALYDIEGKAWGPFAWLENQDKSPELSAFAIRADTYFSTLLSDGRGGEPRWLRPVLNGMLALAGVAPVSYFRDISSVTERQFESKFAEIIGCKPKQFLQTLRFTKFLSRCESGTEDIISIANECGFYDQAHLCHEIKRITGYTPQQYIKTNTQLFGN
jgi:Transcriptional regulator containing an amidase domain and an AraC-type DNA-binding HTH domain